MEQLIGYYISYLRDVKRASQNTIQSYNRDLRKMQEYYRENGVKYQYTVKNAQTGKLIKATNHKQNLPKSWQKYVKTMSW